MDYYFIHDYKEKTYYIKVPPLSTEQKYRNKVIYGSSFGIHRLLIKDEDGVTELTTNSVKQLNITNGILDDGKALNSNDISEVI